jgi:hypothetical protein
MPQPKADEWEDVESNWEDEIPSTPVKSSSYVNDAWEWANKPLTTAPSTFAKSVANQVDAPTYEEPWRIPFSGGATWKGLGAGMMEGAGDVLTSLSSPLNLATAAATGGSGALAKRGMATGARGLALTGKALSAPVAVHGGMEVARPDATMAERGFGLAELAGGIAGMKQPVPTIKKSGGLGKVGTSLVDDIIPENIVSEVIPEKINTPEPIKAKVDDGFEDILSTMENEISPDMSMEIVNDDMISSNNASGDGVMGTSQEEINRFNSMKEKGDSYVKYDRNGKEFPIIGVKAQDYVVQPGETFGIKHADGTFTTHDNQGGKVTIPYAKPPKAAANEMSPKREFTNNPDPLAQNTKPDGQIPEPLPSAEVKKLVPQEQIPQRIQNINKEANLLKMAPKAEREGLIRKALGFNKSLITAYDLSAPGRQGKSLILNKAWWTSLDDMVNAWGSEAAAKTVNDSIIDHPSGYFKGSIDDEGFKVKSFAEKAGLDLASTEEMFNSNIGKQIGKWSGVEKSSRAHTAFLNKLRSDQFVSFMDQAKASGVNPDLNLAKTYAEFINDATGRGSLNVGKWKLERNTKALSDVFFAPKNMAGQIRTWNRVLNPYMYAQADPVLRKQALKSLFAIAGTGAAVGEVARLGGAQVNNDPTNPDFRKIKIGDTRIDLFGGYQQFPVAAMKLLTGKSTSSTTGKVTDLTGGKYGQQTRGSVASRFFVNRLAPLPSFVWAWMDNTEFDGQPFEAKRALLERTMPIVLKDMTELAQEDTDLAALMAIPSIMGLSGTQVYTGR